MRIWRRNKEAHILHEDTGKRQNRSKRSKRLGLYIPYGLFQTKGEMCATFCSDWFRNVNLYKVQTNAHTQTNIHFYYPTNVPLHSFSKIVFLTSLN
jgi:hypothetical protein